MKTDEVIFPLFNFEELKIDESLECREVARFLGKLWTPCSEQPACLPCLACDFFGQLFIPASVVCINGKCYEGQNFNFDVKEFLKGKKVELSDGSVYYRPPREIIAWMPLPKAYTRGTYFDIQTKTEAKRKQRRKQSEKN